MSDIKLSYDSNIGEFDIGFFNGDFVLDDGLETAVAISLFSEARVPDSDYLPEHAGNRSGWWADETLPDNDRIGSLLWLLNRKSITTEMIRIAHDYAVDALQWMVADGVAKTIEVSIEKIGLNSLAFHVVITSPEDVIYKYKLLWSAQNAA